MTKPGTIPLRERRTLADEWRDFEHKVVPPEASEPQRRDMKRSYYAGAAVMFSLMSSGLDEDKEPTDIDIQYVTQLRDELVTFARDIFEGRA